MDAASLDSVVLRFDRGMDPTSLRYLRRMSFLLPLTVKRFEGRWDPERTRVVFDLTQFPVQPGTLYEAVFAGLRSADGELYNLGPYRVWFRTRGEPDLFPLKVPRSLATRAFCHRDRADAQDCTYTSRLEIQETGRDSLAMRSLCVSCDSSAADRRDLFRRNGSRLEWLGFELHDANGEIARRVRWPQPPALLDVPVCAGAVLEGAAQTAGDGTLLEGWRAVVGGLESPVCLLEAPGLPIQIVFSESRIVELDFTIVDADGRREHRHERWWLYAGVGLVQREVQSESSDRPGKSFDLQTYTPSLTAP